MSFPRIPFILLLAVCPAFSKPLAPNGFVESEQPFLRSALIVSEKPMNRVRRGILLPLGNDIWTCFDPDLLRYAAIWKAPAGQAPLSMDSMAGISYPDGTAKAERPPKLVGELITSTKELPGVGVRALPAEDIREGELIGGGKVGAMPPGAGRYLGLVLSGDRVVIDYRIGQRFVREMNRSLGADLIERKILVLPGADPIAIAIDSAIGKTTMDGKQANVVLADGEMPHLAIEGTGSFLVRSDPKTGIALLIQGGTEERVIRILRSGKAIGAKEPLEKLPEFLPATPPFPGEIEATGPDAEMTGMPIVSRPISFPENNPWERKIRPTDLDFLPNGDALVTTLDGDVWRVKDIGEKTATWSRAAFGLFEPMSIEANAKYGVFVLGRDQITRLEDIDGDGFFDVYACASDAFRQTLHSRDYATSLEIYDDGSFIIARAGLGDSGKSAYAEMSSDRGSVLRISPNGLGVTTLADGLRVPFMAMGWNGAIFVSDQQGNFIPSSPIHILSTGTPPLGHGAGDIPFLGYEPTNFRKVKEPVPPLLWFPYQINRSGASFATLSEKAFPSLGDSLAHLSWSGRIFPVVTPEKGLPFAWKLPVDFDFPILNAETNPGNGKLYATGIGISGYKVQTEKDAGIAEIHQSGALAAPTSLDLTGSHIVVGFREALPASMSVVAPKPEVDLWNIKRTPKYGSGHYRWDGTPGEHRVTPVSVRVSEDRRKVAIEVPPVFRADILRLRLHFRDTASDQKPYEIEIYTKPDPLPVATKSDLAKVAEREKKSAVAMVPGDSATGARMFANYGCTGCHSLEGAKLTGPPLNGIAGRHDKAEIDAFLRTSILDPASVIAEGYEPSMPSFEGVIPEQDIIHIVAFLKSLK